MRCCRVQGGGLVEFSNAADAANAIATLNDTELKGRLIFVREVCNWKRSTREGGITPHLLLCDVCCWRWPSVQDREDGGAGAGGGKPAAGGRVASSGRGGTTRVYVGNVRR